MEESVLLPISALQHVIFCERQCALIHIEGLWVENRLTVEGRHLHERVDSARAESRGRLRVARGVPLRSERLGLVGRADTVEFHRLPAKGDASATGIELCGVEGRWQPFPVEYKRGRPKRDGSDEVQLCAQALCLEEMLIGEVPVGALYYGKQRRRTDVKFDRELRDLTEGTARRLHELIASGVTPRARREPKCRRCSMFDICLPHGISPSRSAAGYLRRALEQILGSGA